MIESKSRPWNLDFDQIYLVKQNAQQKIYFSYSLRQKCIPNLRTLPMHFRQEFVKYWIQKVVKVIVRSLFAVRFAKHMTKEAFLKASINHR